MATSRKLVALVVGLLAGCGGKGTPAATHANDVTGACGPEDVSLTAADGMTIHGTWRPVCDVPSAPVVVLAHQMCSDRAEWSAAPHDWVSALAGKGIATLAIDLRGHGASTAFADGTTHDLCAERKNEEPSDRYLGMVDDVRAAVAWAAGKGHPVGVAGASIGSNSALVVAGDGAVAAVVALSPGLDYRGIRPEDAVKATDAKLLLVAAADDVSSQEAVDAFAKLAKHADVMSYPEGGHANVIFEAHPDDFPKAVAWLAAALGR